MRKNFLTVAAALTLLLGLQACDNAKDGGAGNPAIDNIMTRVSVREYTGADVSPEQVETLLKAAMAAPTAVNKQPWSFVVVRDKATRQAIADSISSMKMAAEAPVLIVTCGDMERALDGDAQDFWVQDVSAATENLLLAANAMGLGAVWCGVYPLAPRVAFISDLLGLPDEIVPLAVVPVGVPKGENEPKEKWDPAKIHYEKWKE